MESVNRYFDAITQNGTEKVLAYWYKNFPLEKLCTETVEKKKKHTVNECFSHCMTFDIETTTIKQEDPYGFMYIWQACIMGVCVYGRTWAQFNELMDRICKYLAISKDKKLICYIHNASFEFQFLQNFIHIDKIFATDMRKLLYFDDARGIEFRCSYLLTNMSLEKACLNEKGVRYFKASGDLDYSIIRTPYTPLNDVEFGYCISDVLCLYELIENKLRNEKDTLLTIPLTSTGYVRRYVRSRVNHDVNYRKLISRCKLSTKNYQMLIDCARGGNTHANYMFSGRIMHNVFSFDVVSSYPSQMLLRNEFPLESYKPYGTPSSWEDFERLMKQYSCIFYVRLRNVRFREETYSMPYIAKSKMLNNVKCIEDNGRVLECNDVMLCINEIDYRIIRKQYDFELELKDIVDFSIAKKGMLPKVLRDCVYSLFKDKCELKCKIKNRKKFLKKSNATITSEELEVIYNNDEELKDLNYYYAKSKNLLNAVFGMCFTNPVHEEILYNLDSEDVWKHESKDIAKELEKYNNSYNTFLNYAWGSVITALAREWLETLLDTVGNEYLLYCDTDSAKVIRNEGLIERVNDINNKIMQHCDKIGGYCDVDGTRFYLGIYEQENDDPYSEFCTLGAKKYAYVENGVLHATISGVNKKAGAKELGNIHNFVHGFQFVDSASLMSTYNDVKEPYELEINGSKFLNGSNIALTESTYTLGITSSYAELLDLDIDIFFE